MLSSMIDKKIHFKLISWLGLLFLHVSTLKQSIQVLQACLIHVKKGSPNQSIVSYIEASGEFLSQFLILFGSVCVLDEVSSEDF